MNKRKIIIVDESTEKALSSLCDAALKYAGMQIVGTVNAVASAVKEEEVKEE